MHSRKLRRITTLALAAATLALAPAARAQDEPDRPREEKPRPVDVGVLGGVGFPRPVAVEAIARIDRRFLLGVEYGFLPEITVQNVDARLWAASADARWFPFRGAFFVGMRAGYQKASADTTVSVSGLSTTAAVEMRTWFLNPRVGFLWVWKPVAFGIDAGLQIPMSTDVTRSSVIALASPEADARITSVTNTIGRNVLPTVDLLRVGLVF